LLVFRYCLRRRLSTRGENRGDDGMAYNNKYGCTNQRCLRNYWSLSEPESCPHCGHRVRLLQQGTTDLPSSLYNEKAVEKDVGQFMSEFEEWWHAEG
jgi:hypothetical protein